MMMMMMMMNKSDQSRHFEMILKTSNLLKCYQQVCYLLDLLPASQKLVRNLPVRQVSDKVVSWNAAVLQLAAISVNRVFWSAIVASQRRGDIGTEGTAGAFWHGFYSTTTANVAMNWCFDQQPPSDGWVLAAQSVLPAEPDTTSCLSLSPSHRRCRCCFKYVRRCSSNSLPAMTDTSGRVSSIVMLTSSSAESHNPQRGAQFPINRLDRQSVSPTRKTWTDGEHATKPAHARTEPV